MRPWSDNVVLIMIKACNLVILHATMLTPVMGDNDIEGAQPMVAEQPSMHARPGPGPTDDCRTAVDACCRKYYTYCIIVTLSKCQSPMHAIRDIESGRPMIAEPPSIHESTCSSERRDAN